MTTENIGDDNMNCDNRYIGVYKNLLNWELLH